jgi:hypothetical protein
VVLYSVVLKLHVRSFGFADEVKQSSGSLSMVRKLMRDLDICRIGVTRVSIGQDSSGRLRCYGLVPPNDTW